MNNKGFTLIELIMVIALLAVIALLTTPNIIKILDKNKVDNYNNTIDSIISASEVYVSDNKYNLKFINISGNNDFCRPADSNDKNIFKILELRTLIDNKYIKGVVKNHCTDADVSIDDISVKIILNCGSRNFSYEVYDAGNNFFKDVNNKIIKKEACE